MIYRVGWYTADGGGFRSWQARTAAIYADGGCIKSNPSPFGGTWAWCAVDADGWMIHSEHGWYDPPSYAEGGMELRDGVGVTENNVSEFLAILLGLRTIKAADPGWNGLVFTDSLLTIKRWTASGSLKNIPYVWRRAMGEILRMPGAVGTPSRWTLLDGHPSKPQLAANSGKRGNPVSVHNQTCDKLCQQAAIRYHHRLAGTLDLIDIDPLDTRAVAV